MTISLMRHDYLRFTSGPNPVYRMQTKLPRPFNVADNAVELVEMIDDFIDHASRTLPVSERPAIHQSNIDTDNPVCSVETDRGRVDLYAFYA